MVAYHVVNDTINYVPVMVARCEACSGSAAFNPVLDVFGDKALTFQNYGNANGTFNVYDYQAQTAGSPFTGRSTEGPPAPYENGPDTPRFGALEGKEPTIPGY